LTKFSKFLVFDKQKRDFWRENYLKFIYYNTLNFKFEKWRNLKFLAKFSKKFALFDKQKK